MHIKIIYGYCFPESAVYPTENGDIDGWTLTHLRIPDIFKTLDKTDLSMGYYNYHLEKGHTGTYVSLKDIEGVNGCTMPIRMDDLIKEAPIINTESYSIIKRFPGGLQIKDIIKLVQNIDKGIEKEYIYTINSGI